MEPRLFRLTAVVLCACGGAGGGNDDDRSTRIAGAAYWSGPVRGATVVAYQLVDGERTLEVARGATGDDGAFALSTGLTYEHVELDVIGGRFVEASGSAAGGEVALDGGAVLRGAVLDLVIGEERGGVVVSPWTHVAVELGHARLRGGEDATYGAAVGTALARLRVHTGFDVVATPVASLAVAAASPTDDVRHALTLGGLSELAALAAAEQGATVQSVNVVALTRVLARDAASAEARLDGNGDEALFVGAACPPPSGCAAEGPGCYAACAVHASTLRARLGGAVLSFLLGPENRTTLGRDDLGPWLEAMRTNVDPQLFGGEAPEPFDARGPAITWHAPAEGATVAGAIAVEVSAMDPVGVASLAVTAEGVPLVDTDPAPDRFATTLATAGLPEGALILTATARDTEGNEGIDERPIVVDNLAGGAISGVVFKGRVGGAAVRVYGFAGGVRGAMLGEGTTAADGTFANLRVADGYSGPLLVEAGFGGTYSEEAATATVTLDVADRLRTVVPAYTDGGAVVGVTVSPLTSFAVTYGEYLGGSGQGGATVAERWATARGAMEAHFGVASIGGVVPQAPAEMSTFNAPARYGLVLVGLSELARAASTLGGGDGGTFGPAMSSLRVVRALELDLADGCWDGRQGTAPLYFGGTQAVSARATRLDLATAIAAYLDDGARNQTPYAGAADVLALLDTLASGGGNGAPGGCATTGGLHPDAGSAFDQTPPAIAISTVPAGPVLGGVITVMAVASDALDVRPSLRFTAPVGTVDGDGDPGDADATAAVDTRVFLPGTEGALAVSLESFDDAGNHGTATALLTIDNRAPEVTVTGVSDGAWYSGPVTPVVSASDGHLASFTVTLDGAPWSAGTAITAEGRHVLVAAALDAAGNTTTRTITFHVDLTDPTLAATPAWPPWLRGTATLRVLADDSLRASGSLGADITVAGTGPGGPLAPATLAPVPTLLPGGQRQLDVAVDTTAVGDGGLTVRFDVVDRAGRAAAPLVIARQIDNTPPAIALLPVRNQAGVQIDGFVSEPAAQIRGTATPGGSPVTVTVTVNPGAITATATPDATGVWSVLTPALGEGAFTVSATAVDGAGNTSPGPAAGGFTVDRTAPTLGLLQSTALDERNCDVAVNVAVASGTVGATPVTYGACDGTGSPIRLDTITAAVHLGKFTTRLTALPADNPLTWLPQATDGAGVGLADAPTSIQYRVYRTGQPPPASWAATAAPALSNGVLSAQATATDALAPELRTHTALFTVELRATDRLGNTSTATLTRTWLHHPLAPPVLVRYVAPTDPDDPALGAFSLFKHSLTPAASQVGLAGAMSSGFLADAPRGLYELEVWNPHPEPINVGFYIPSFSGVTYATRVWEVNPYISGSAGLVGVPPASTCGWPARTTVFRMSGGAAPFTCGSGTTCTCLAGPLADSKPAATTGAITSAALRIVAWDATPAVPVRLPPQSLSPTVDGHTFYEFTVPARAASSPVATHLRVMVALPNLDLFSPSDDVANQLVLESDGAGAEVHIFRSGNTSFSPTMTAVFKERWADCYAYNATTNNCTDMHARRRLRATVQVALNAPVNAISPYVRTRAAAATTAAPEAVPAMGASDGRLRATHAATWSSCETAFPLSCPTIPDYANGAAF